MGFEFNPADDESRDPHGECCHEIHRLKNENDRLRCALSEFEASNSALRDILKQPSMRYEWVADKILEWMDEQDS